MSKERLLTAMTESERIAAWDDEARKIIADLERYEAEHPRGATCLLDVLGVARHGVVRA